jgi:small subunit ribosomal protein S16
LVKIRLRRIGRKKLPIYKIVAADSRTPRDGRFIESVGIYNPNTHPAQIDLDEDRTIYWLKSGAKPTLTVKNLFSRRGILLKLHLIKKNTNEEKINQEISNWSAIQENKIKKDSEKKLKRKENRKKTKKKKELAEQPSAENSTPQ